MEALLKNLPVLTCIVQPNPNVPFIKDTLIKYGIAKLDYHIALITQFSRSSKSLTIAINHFKSKKIECSNLNNTKLEFAYAYGLLYSQQGCHNEIVATLLSLSPDYATRLKIERKGQTIDKIRKDTVKETMKQIKQIQSKISN
ncbi:MAG: hypothetical protein ACI9TY_000827 [Alphaproteobacteria bacterium]|jgi:hypothetical protein